MSKPTLEDFERYVFERKGDDAYRAALSILGRIDRAFGRIDQVQMRPTAEPGDEGVRLERFSTRFVAALGQLICDEAITPDRRIFAQILLFHRWIDLMFASSGFRTPDNFLRVLGVENEGAWSLKGDHILRFLLLFSPRADFNISFEKTLSANPHMSAIAFLNFLGTRYCFTERSHDFRERLLEWLPGRLNDVKLGPIVLRNIAEPFMHCSYAQTPRKHEIKADLIAQMRRACLGAGCREMSEPPAPAADGKPVVVIMTEHFSKGHSVWRTHSRAVKALREKFHTVGFCAKRAQMPDVEAAFDEFIVYPEAEFFEGVRKTCEMILERRPVMVFHLGVGMADVVIATSSLRLAPVQACSFGHTATTKSPVIDYMILPEDFMGDPECFSEKMVLVPPQAMPYTPVDNIDIDAVLKKTAKEKAVPGVVRVAVAASIMKLNPPFFAALKAAADAAKTRVEYHFFPLAGVGLAHADLQRALKTRLPQAVVHTEQPYDKYMLALARCAFAISPFPYGNMNSIIDAARLGLPGVCLDGPEAHAHADVAYFARLGLPSELAAETVEDYSAVITRLVDDKAFLEKCRAAAKSADLDKGFFTGDESLFCKAVEELVSPHL
ncbi:MAG TPA: hypothetical protein VG407_13995 [Caulobacteraceae bacterium]|jgi:hypothetical protein|nr:hypothetical protein [Caulobacteraceae bacterium]